MVEPVFCLFLFVYTVTHVYIPIGNENLPQHFRVTLHRIGGEKARLHATRPTPSLLQAYAAVESADAGWEVEWEDV